MRTTHFLALQRPKKIDYIIMCFKFILTIPNIHSCLEQINRYREPIRLRVHVCQILDRAGFHSNSRRGSRILERGGGRGVWVINWQCAHRRSAPGGLKACPLGTFEMLDAFSCNLVHIPPPPPSFSLFLPIFCG